MIFFKIKDLNVNPVELKQFLLKRGIKTFINSNIWDSNRFIVHHYIRDQQVEEIVKGFRDYHITIETHKQ